MQSGKKAVETVKETAANIGASAISGKDKTKATMQEKVDKMKAKDDFQKDLATERKEQRITEAELFKQRTQANNLDLKEARTGIHTTTGLRGAGTGAHQMSAMPGHGTGQPTGAHQMSAMPGHGTGQPTGGHVVEGTAVGSHPIGTGTTVDNKRVGGGTTNTGLTGGGYSG